MGTLADKGFGPQRDRVFLGQSQCSDSEGGGPLADCLLAGHMELDSRFIRLRGRACLTSRK